ncbi:signal peptidase I [Halosegnis longus]|uniref:signal peptidase I n=1 Tax=Halosegnis longus TaxID=2216012 RepID=UPI00129E505A|nr:signal peptidase I [Halosegnis longus]
MTARLPSGQTIGAIVLILAVLPFVVYAVPQVAGASHSYVVLSDSMSPEINAGDVVVVDDQPTPQIEQNQVITYERPESDQLVTHRVVAVLDENGETAFRTKGDANEDVDPQPVPTENVVGVVQFHIPLIGHVVSFASSDAGLLVFVILPATGLAVSEVVSLYRDATASGADSGESSDANELPDGGGD